MYERGAMFIEKSKIKINEDSGFEGFMVVSVYLKCNDTGSD